VAQLHAAALPSSRNFCGIARNDRRYEPFHSLTAMVGEECEDENQEVTMRRYLRDTTYAAVVLCQTVAAVLLGGAALAAEDAVLLASTTPGYAPGMVVASGDRLRLPEGASVTLLLRSGEMLRLRGPLETALETAVPARNAGSAVALADVFRARGVDASVIGGARASTVVRHRAPPEDIILDVQQSGTWCVGPSDTLWLTRPAEDVSALALRRRGNVRSVAWPPGASRVEWPSDVQAEDGDRFEVLVNGNATATLTIRLMSATNRSEAAKLAEAILLGCREQYQTALRRLARAAVPTELWLTTDRGRNGAAYRSGEPVELVVMANMPGFLYCVVEQADNTATAVFPAGALDGARLPEAVPIALQGHRRSLAVQAGPRGTARVQCWLADRDVAPELPHALLDASGSRLPDQLAAELDGVFARIRGSRMAKATVELRID
jgi:hypothetical protein